VSSPVRSSTSAGERPVETAGRRHPRPVRLFSERYLLVGVWLLLAIFFAVAKPDSFLQAAAFHTIFGSYAIYVLMGLAALITSVVAQIDLSVVFVVGLSATVVPTSVTYWGFDIWAGVLVAVATGLACGALNALLVVKLRVNSFIATLGSGTVYLGIATGIAHEQPVAGLSEGFNTIAVEDVLGVPLTFWYGLVLAVFLTYFLAFTPLGRHMAFVGSNREVARLAGIRVTRILFGSYVAGGLLSGITGVLLSAQLGGYDPASTSAYLLPVFAILFLGASVVRPGRFNPVGIVIAAYFIATGTLGLQLFGLTGWVNQVFYGGALVVAVAVVTAVRKESGGAELH
jgi:ribose transport system permease protein